MGQGTKMDQFSEKLQTAFDPPPHFEKIMLQIHFKFHAQKALLKSRESAT